MAEFAVATLVELQSDFKTPKSNGRKAKIQFNPETLKVSYSNQLAGKDKQTSGNASDGTSAAQLVGKGSTKLSLQLWFDVTAPMPTGQPPSDVRQLTRDVINLMNPSPSGEPEKFLTPAVEFRWGSFIFAGIIDALDETLEFFSPDGIPLRASMNLSMSQQTILVPVQGQGSGRPGAGARPLSQASAGSTLQGMVAAAGQGADWQSIAAANGIENPRRLDTGRLLDLSRKISGGLR
jgi:hypothetical protein